MHINNGVKKKSSLILAILMVMNLIIMTVVSGVSDTESLEKSLSDDNAGLFHIEVMKDEDGQFNIEGNSITWKLVYNKDQKSIDNQSFKLELSEGMHLKYEEGISLDLENQPKFTYEKFDSKDYEVKNTDIEHYEVEDRNINNPELISTFMKNEAGNYEIELAETNETHEIIFTTECAEEFSS